MFLQLVFQRLVRYGTPGLAVGVFEQRHGQVFHLVLRELHSVFFHARAHHVLQLPMLYETVACINEIVYITEISIDLFICFLFFVHNESLKLLLLLFFNSEANGLYRMTCCYVEKEIRSRQTGRYGRV